ncbi:diguanylate cyclase [Paenibacillus tritici]|uniref:sensor domain-containing diguanylate cyclase n=1 Tax=Paenibacillus tritici TaxID=1873425 RepID=UPI001BAB84DC|nr:sensor domain-containing diguanylate cyclase [Paenibacillus tritici]QUL53234.1 diguanylate cyclase [Paenibacillus tritici]
MYRGLKSTFCQSKKLSLTTLLTGLVTLVILLTSSILLIGSYKSKKQSLMETTLHLNYINADRMSRTMDSLFVSMHNSLKYNAGRLSDIEAMAPEQVNESLDQMRSSSNFFNSITMVEASGFIRNVSPASLGTAGKHITSKNSQVALALRKPYISSPYLTANTNRLIVFLSQPVVSSAGTYLGMLSGTIYLQENNILSEIFDNGQEDDSGAYYYIVDSEGHLVYHPDKQRIGQDVSSNAVVQQLLNKQSGEQPVRNLKGIDLLAGYSSVPANGWGIVVVSPVSQIQHELVGHIRILIWYCLGPFIILLLGVILLARKFARPFVYLADVVSRMGTEKIELQEAKRYWSREAYLLTDGVSLALDNIQQQTEQLTQEAATDVLTGLMNRRSLEYTIRQWMASGVPFSLVMLDVDHFKLVNDTHGHHLGDEVLKHVVRMIVTSLRPDDVCYRYGGEEFVILLTRTLPAEAFSAAERIRKAVERSKAPIPEQLTVSQGIAHYPSHASDLEGLLGRADQALYLAKSRGRNRTVITE